MTGTRVPLFDRLPEIYRIRDTEHEPPGQLRAYLAACRGRLRRDPRQHRVALPRSVHRDLRRLGHPLHRRPARHDPPHGRPVDDPRRRRRHRSRCAGARDARRDRAARLRCSTGWAVHCVELRENLGWPQHLNHQRPGCRRRPALRRADTTRFTVLARRHGAAPRPSRAEPARDAVRPVRPHPRREAAAVATLCATTCPTSRSSCGGSRPTGCLSGPVYRRRPRPRRRRRPAGPLAAARSTCTRWRRPAAAVQHQRATDPDRQPPVLTAARRDCRARCPRRLTSGAEAGHPDAYVCRRIRTTPTTADASTWPRSACSCTSHGRPRSRSTPGASEATTFAPGRRPSAAGRCAMARSLIDPVIGRLRLGVETTAAGDARAVENICCDQRARYGAPGPVGAHPVTRERRRRRPGEGEARAAATSIFRQRPAAAHQASSDLATATQPVVIEIRDSLVHRVDLAAVAGTVARPAAPAAAHRSLTIRAADGQRPVIRLAGRSASARHARPDRRPSGRTDAAPAARRAARGPLSDATPTASRRGAPLIARAAVPRSR